MISEAGSTLCFVSDLRYSSLSPINLASFLTIILEYFCLLKRLFLLFKEVGFFYPSGRYMPIVIKRKIVEINEATER